MRLLLTDRFCARAAARSAQTDYFDETVKGLALRVGVKRKAWTLHLTVAGKRSRLSLGSYPALSLGGARARALTMLSSASAGIDPRTPDTVRAVSEEYMRRATIRTKGWRQNVLERLVYPTFGARPIDEIRRSEIARLLDQIEDGSGPSMADQTLAVIRRIMNWHASRSDEFRSPIVRGMARTKPHERARERTLTDAELRAIWSATAAGRFGRFARFVLLTACRRGEAAFAQRSEIVGGDWIVPAARYKTGKDHLVPLSQAARGLAEGQGEYLFGAGPVFSIHRHKVAIDKASGVTGWTLHDLRRTARSLMSRAGVPSDHAERCLGHVIGGVRGTYDRHEYREEKRLAFEALASLIERIVDPQPNVVAMRGGSNV
jgi:integrase